MTYRIPLSYTPIASDDIAAVLARYASKSHTEMVSDFEKLLAEYTGSRYVVALNSGTAAIHLALKALGVGRGDDVLVSTFTYVATINPIVYLGATPVFIDSEQTTWNLDPELLERAITRRMQNGTKPKAILVVHAYGMPAQLDQIMEIAGRHNIPVVEDAAEAIGSTCNNRALGTFGKVGILSFNNNKLLTTYGGGALLTNDETIYKNALHWASQSRDDRPYYQHSEIGYSYRIASLSAVAGIAAMPQLGRNLASRRAIYDNYRTLLNDWFDFLPEPASMKSNRWLSTAALRSKVPGRLENLQAHLKGAGIETRPLWKPMDQQPAFVDYPRYLNGTSDQLFSLGLCLPSSDDLGILGVNEVSNAIRTFLR